MMHKKKILKGISEASRHHYPADTQLAGHHIISAPVQQTFKQSTDKHNSTKRCAAIQLSAFGLVQKHAISGPSFGCFQIIFMLSDLQKTFWHAGKKQKMQQADRW